MGEGVSRGLCKGGISRGALIGGDEMGLCSTWGEALETSPYAGLSTPRVEVAAWLMGHELVTHRCKTCRKIFEAHPEHRYRREDDNYRAVWFCSYKCMRVWDREFNAKWDAVIEECFKELEFLDAQSRLPIKDRDPRVYNIYRQTVDCESRLNTAIVRKMKGYS